MTLATYAGKHVVILGLARQGLALARFFLAQRAHVTISDVASADRLAGPLTELAGAGVRLVLGGHPLSLLEECDLLCLSGGVPPQIPLVEEARRQGISLSNDALLTVERSTAPAIGITGSSGKTTTTTLTGLMLASAGFRVATVDAQQVQRAGPEPHVWVGGNIGTPLVDRLDQVAAGDWLVLELSSFQLELFDGAAGGRSLSPQVAAVLNVTPNHLDRHPSMAHYAVAKANVLRWQGPDGVAILGADDATTGTWLRRRRVRIEAGAGQKEREFPLEARLLGFGLGEPQGEGCWLHQGGLVVRAGGREQPVVKPGELQLRGQHNVLNVMAACAMAGALGIDPQAMAQVARTFRGVAHRLEVVRELEGVRWVNDSIATTPERAVAALRSFDEPIILLAGGRDKKLPWSEFARLVHQKVTCLVVFGEAAGLIANAVTADPASSGPRLIVCDDLEQAVAAAAGVATAGDVVLLAPGGTSYDAYKDFEARGEHFRALVNTL